MAQARRRPRATTRTGAPRRVAGSPSPGSTRSAASRPVRHRPIDRGGRLPWPLRLLAVPLVVAVLAAVVLLVTGSLGSTLDTLGGAVGNFAGIFGTRLPAQSAAPPASSSAGPQVPAPALLGRATAVAPERQVTLRVRVPAQLAGRPRHELRIRVNGRIARELRLPRRREFTVRDITLRRGDNEITATIASPAGESAPSNPLRMVFDDQPPELRVTAPRDRGTVHASRAAVIGTTQPGSRVTVRNTTTGAEGSALAGAGRFAVSVELDPGTNLLQVVAIDPGGNRTSTELRVVRGRGDPTADLSLSTVVLLRRELPSELSMSVRVEDADGRPVEGARATFSLSPPGIPTSTFTTTTRRGTASWPDVSVPREGTMRGKGIVTVRVELPNGRAVQDSREFIVR